MELKAQFRRPGGTFFIAGAALLMAGLVIVTMLVLNATLDKALSPRTPLGGSVISGPPAPPSTPLLQVYATPAQPTPTSTVSGGAPAPAPAAP